MIHCIAESSDDAHIGVDRVDSVIYVCEVPKTRCADTDDLL